MTTNSPPTSPQGGGQRPASAIARPANRSSSRLSMTGGKTVATGSRASDEESRTAVKVAVRVRPALKPTDPGYELIPQRFQRSMVQTTSNTSLAIDSPQGKKLFVFDRVFSSDVMQDGVWEYLSESISAFTQGYNVSLLAYGQSGAGKSYTMGTSGPLEQHDEEIMGVIPRAAKALFEKLDISKAAVPVKPSNRNSMSHLRTPRGYGQQNTLGDADWSLKATYVEIYNEQLRDLLVPESTPMADRGNVAIREDVKGNIILTGLRQVDITCVDDLINALNFGSSIRQTDATAINAKSSRSHAVFSLNLVQRKNKNSPTSTNEKRFSVPIEAMTGQEVTITTDSKLHFVDLAGSERLKNTGAHGERAKEGISINAGLASLGKVISQLSSRQAGSHVSYRDSKLTRLLQDSLGGNAITYMIACVTPAEFHLSETLNTVQYAQRARAIQSKPRIQQVEEGDKQAIIDRLKVEIAFLREQISSNANRGEPSPRRLNLSTNERFDRQSEREAELQNQLLDTQENYTALSQRHAKLISEMAKARENESSNEAHELGDTATDRLNRSNSFAQAVEQVVMEYEKTIQSLEHSLSSTRGTLSNTEASLLEKESKCAYAETINTQLQARLQKLMDREASTENYLHDLETKLDGHTNGEEKNATIIMELRKEISRVRENEASCEDYISTLEERLAETDQDSELMQREIDRLEQVIERQRSLGKLDSLLYDLDNVQEAKQPGPEPKEPVANGPARRRSSTTGHSRAQSHVSRHSQTQDAIPEDDEGAEDDQAAQIPTVKEEAEETPHVEPRPANGEYDDVQSSAQSKYVADKLENVTQELFDLRVEHETTVNSFDDLHLKYEEAMRKVAELQDAVDEARHSKPSRPRDSIISEATDRPDSFVSETKTNDLQHGLRSSASRSLSSELSSAMDSPATANTSNGDVSSEDETATTKQGGASSDDLTEGPLSPAFTERSNQEFEAEITRFKSLVAEREAAEKELASKYAELESKHSETLDIVEELKTEVHKARAIEASSPRTPTPIIRRKSSQNLLVDRAQRSFSSLRNIANEHLKNSPEVWQNFEVNLNAAMHELHSRSERIQELEADIASTKKEMEAKMTIISGLTRERSSLKASPVDMSMVATLRDQLEQSENQIASLKEAHASREGHLENELEALRNALSGPGADDTIANATKIAQLEHEVSQWELQHKAALETAASKEQELLEAIKQLEAQAVSVHAELQQARSVPAGQDEAAKEAERKQESLISFLRSEIDEYKAIINSNATKVAELETAHATAVSDLDRLNKVHSSVAAELETSVRDREAEAAEASRLEQLVLTLEEQLTAHEEAASRTHQTLESLQAAHQQELADVKLQEQKGYEEQVAVLMSEQADTVRYLEAEVAGTREELVTLARQVGTALGMEPEPDNLRTWIDSLVADRTALGNERKRAGEMEKHVAELSTINDGILKDLENAKKSLADIAPTNSGSMTATVEALKGKLAEMESRNEKNTRMIEELEEQLQSNFDEAQITNNRISTLQTERDSQLEEINNSRLRLQAELESVREEYAALQAKYDETTSDVNRSSVQSAVRKSASHTSLPSPPPVIPLPPLPNGASAPGTPNVNGHAPGSPTSTRPPSKDNFGALSASQVSQLAEDQEARIRTIKKHLDAERQLTQTLEEALTDLEKQSNKVKADCEAWKKRASELELEVKELKEKPVQEAQDNRWSLQAVEEERKKRQAAEAARKQLEDRMNAINKSKKKKGSLNCF
ncbi:unnamed protein product [Clonostachys rosea]|uniref:Kinesin motor domain-containing protein n=1 Tax=Bionectria ochroleuca TaxID=29856 RepID=A0ABY6UZ20_BIOOC|nr:unnamed protein product [Clonostachys rosea]